MHLLIDASFPQLHVGLLGYGRWLGLRVREGEALELLTEGVQALLRESRLGLGDLEGIVYGAGPGSALGLRLMAMTLETWRCLPELSRTPLQRYHGLKLQAALWAHRRGWSDFDLTTDLRRGQWHVLSIRNGIAGEPALVGVEDWNPAGIPCLHLVQRKAFQAPPATAEPVAYDLSDLPDLPGWRDLLEPTERVALLLPPPAEYVRWSSERHRGTAQAQG